MSKMYKQGSEKNYIKYFLSKTIKISAQNKNRNIKNWVFKRFINNQVMLEEILVLKKTTIYYLLLTTIRI